MGLVWFRVDLVVVLGIQLGILVATRFRKFDLRIGGGYPSQESGLDGDAVVVCLVGAGACDVLVLRWGPKGLVWLVLFRVSEQAWLLV